MKTRGFFAMDVCTIDIDFQSFVDADTMYPCINYTLAFTLFQIKRILFMYACENTKLFTITHIKQMGANLMKHVQDLYAENYTMLLKKIKEDLNKHIMFMD